MIDSNPIVWDSSEVFTDNSYYIEMKYCHKASCLELFSYCSFGTIIVKTNLQFYLLLPGTLFWHIFYSLSFIQYDLDLIFPRNCSFLQKIVNLVQSVQMIKMTNLIFCKAQPLSAPETIKKFFKNPKTLGTLTLL